MSAQPDLFKTDNHKPPERKLNRAPAESESCTFEDLKNSDSWQQLNVTSGKEKILEILIIEGIPIK